MRIQEISKNPAVMKYLRWDWMPEPKAQFNPEDAGFYFCIYVRDSKASLVLLHYLPDGSTTQDGIADFPEDMILAALTEAGGKVSEGGYNGKYYPINKPIEELIRLKLRIRKEGVKVKNNPISKMQMRQLIDTLIDLLNKTHGGDYYTRFNEIAKERGRKLESSHFSRLDTVSMQLLIETIQSLMNTKEAKHD